MSTRVEEFIDFHSYCCWNDSIVVQLKAYADLRNLNAEQREWLVLFYGLSYSIPTAIVCFENLQQIKTSPQQFWNENKERLIFQSDRRWVKFNNQFVKSVIDFKQKRIFEQLRASEIINLTNALRLVQSASYFARFASYLLLEAYCFMFQKQTVGDFIDWKRGDTATSGMLNVIGLDKHADYFDQTGKLVVATDTLDSVLNYIQSKTPDAIGRSALFVETTLCAYRKHFKGTRYVGYYVDRVLQELVQTVKNFPNHKNALNILYDARAAVIPAKHLGEFGGWRGIRKNLCKHYIKTGDWNV